jgi:putative thioredoxin
METSDKDFEKEVLESSEKTPVLVDFWAPWCPPCQILGPIIEKIEKDYKGKLKVVKCNVENCRQSAEKHNIMSIPCVKLFKNKKIADSFIGAKSEQDVRDWIDSNLN